MTNKQVSTWAGLVGLALAAGCTADSVDRIEIGEANALGIASIEVNQFAEHGDQVFELRGFDAADHEQALVRVRTGFVADLPSTDLVDDVGSEITFSIGGTDTRMVTRQVQRIQLGALDDAASQSFLELAQVASTLKREAHLVVEHASPTEAAGEIALMANACSANMVLTSPLAKQCCYGHIGPGLNTATKFVNPSNAIVSRTKNPQGTGCKASDGVSACSGTACYYGPFGFGVPTLTTGTGYPIIEIREFYNHEVLIHNACSGVFYPTEPAHTFGDVTGTLARGAGCPGGNSSDGFWDY